MMIAEIRMKEGIVKYPYYTDDYETIMVCSPEGTKFPDGFDIEIQYNAVYKEELNCKIIPKSDVVAIYNDWDDDREYFGNMEADIYKTKDGRVRVEVHDEPTEYKDEFTYEEYLIERGGDVQPIESSRYYLITDADDPRISTATKHIHKDISFEMLPSDLTEEELRERAFSFVKKRMHKSYLVDNEYYTLLMGCYGYRLPHDMLSTDIDLVFERMIPEYYSEIVDDGPYAGSNLCSELNCAICGSVTGWKFCSVILNGKEEHLTPEYKHYMFLRINLKLMEMLQKGVEPYTKMELDWFMENIEEKCSDFIHDHAPVSWNGKIICEDIGAYTKQALEKLSYFEQFRK